MLGGGRHSAERLGGWQQAGLLQRHDVAAFRGDEGDLVRLGYLDAAKLAAKEALATRDLLRVLRRRHDGQALLPQDTAERDVGLQLAGGSLQSEERGGGLLEDKTKSWNAGSDGSTLTLNGDFSTIAAKDEMALTDKVEWRGHARRAGKVVAYCHLMLAGPIAPRDSRKGRAPLQLAIPGLS